MNKRLKGCLISLPVLAAPWMVGAVSTPAMAATDLAPIDALRILAHSRTVNGKCGHMPAVQQEFNDYVAKAEVAAAKLSGADRAQSAVSEGTKEGKAMKCGSASRELVSAAIEAARRAMAQYRAESRKVAGKPVNLRPGQHNAAPKPKPQRRAIDVRPRQQRLVNAAPSGELQNYTRMAAAYYIERRCRHMQHTQAFRFWQIVVREHNRLLVSYGPGQVAQAKSDAQVMAKSGYRGGCGRNTRRIVMERFARIAAR